MIKHALSKMAKVDIPENAIAELVRMPGSTSYQMYEPMQYIEITTDNYSESSEFYVRDFEKIVRDYS
jgi:hypothetical protein